MKPDMNAEPAPAVGDSERDVAEYLRAHPEFFVRHAELVEQLRVPHACGDAVSLLEFQVGQLRERNARLAQKIQELMQNAQVNEDLARRLHRLSLSLLDCAGLDDIFATLYQTLREEFAVDAVAVRVFAAARAPADRGLGEFSGADARAMALFAPVLKAGRPVCGRLKPAHLEYLFAEAGADLRSGALLPLGEGRRFGVLAIGSRAPRRFHAGMGTTFLQQLSELVSRVLAPHVDTA